MPQNPVLSNFITTRKLSRWLKIVKAYLNAQDAPDEVMDLGIEGAEAYANSLQDKYGFSDPGGKGSLYVRKDPLEASFCAANPIECLGKSSAKPFFKSIKSSLKASGDFKNKVNNIKAPTQEQMKNFRNANGGKRNQSTLQNTAKQAQTKPLQSKGFLNDKNKSDPWNTKEYHEFKNTVDKFNESNLGYPTPAFAAKVKQPYTERSQEFIYNDIDRFKKNSPNQKFGNYNSRTANSPVIAGLYLYPAPPPMIMLNPEFEDLLSQGYDATSTINNLLNDNSSSLSDAEAGMINAKNAYFANLYDDDDDSGFWGSWFGGFLRGMIEGFVRGTLEYLLGGAGDIVYYATKDEQAQLFFGD